MARAAPTDVLGDDDARHLLARTGFGPTAAEVAAFAPLTREQAVERLLAETRTQAQRPPPAAMLAQEPVRFPGRDATLEERRAFNQRNTREGLELRAWWLQEMVTTPSPLTERMTLFWHNHFVSSQQKVRFARLMYAQNADVARARARQLRDAAARAGEATRRCSSTSTSRRTGAASRTRTSRAR